MTELPQIDWSPTHVGLRSYFHARKSELATPDELARLRELQAEWNEFQRQLSLVDTDEPRRRLDAMRNAYSESPSAATFAKLQRSLESVETVRDEIRQTRAVIKKVLNKWFREACLPGCLRPLQRACELAHQFADDLEQRERLESADCGLAIYQPSQTLRAVQSRIRQLEATAEAIASGRATGLSSPQGMLADIVQLDPA